MSRRLSRELQEDIRRTQRLNREEIARKAERAALQLGDADLCMTPPPLDPNFYGDGQTHAPRVGGRTARERQEAEALLRKLGKADALYDVAEREIWGEEEIRRVRAILQREAEAFR